MSGDEKRDPFNNPFAKLESARDKLPSVPVPVSESPPRPPKALAARAVVRMERKGRGGKTATVVEQLGLSSKELDRFCRELKQALGCGGTVEGSTIVLQGDLRERVRALLLERGVRKVSLG
jgi:translation initiation factor 1